MFLVLVFPFLCCFFVGQFFTVLLLCLLLMCFANRIVTNPQTGPLPRAADLLRCQSCFGYINNLCGFSDTLWTVHMLSSCSLSLCCVCSSFSRNMLFLSFSRCLFAFLQVFLCEMLSPLRSSAEWFLVVFQCSLCQSQQALNDRYRLQRQRADLHETSESSAEFRMTTEGN
jgi:hypothetical protein